MKGDKGSKMAGAMAVVAGRAIRPCDVCGLKRSRWYCAADEAFLCEVCDSTVHAANALALRHERVRLSPNGAPMKMERRNNINNSGEPLHVPSSVASSSAGSKKKSKRRPAFSKHHPISAAGPAAFSVLQETQLAAPTSNISSAQLREVKVELNHGTDAHETEYSDDHFTAEELTGNANLLNHLPPNCQAGFNDSSTAPGCNHGMMSEADFGHDFLVSDPNDPNNNNCGNNPEVAAVTPSSAERVDGDVVDDEEDEEEEYGIGNEWMELDLGHRDGSDDEYCINLEALRGSTCGDGSHDTCDYGSPADGNYKSANDAESGLTTLSSKVGKPFKNTAVHSEWVKLEEGMHHHGYEVPLTSPCKIEGLNDCDLRQVPSLRLNYADVLSSWPDRGMLWVDSHGSSSSQLVPDDSNSDAMGGCYEMGLVPDLSNPGGGGGGHLAAMCCGSGVGTGAGEDSILSACNAREARVSRYREKRRTRLFSKKIRYEVRKLNAERRPRMKGRFVKRSPGREV